LMLQKALRVVVDGSLDAAKPFTDSCLESVQSDAKDFYIALGHLKQLVAAANVAVERAGKLHGAGRKRTPEDEDVVDEKELELESSRKRRRQDHA